VTPNVPPPPVRVTTAPAQAADQRRSGGEAAPAATRREMRGPGTPAPTLRGPIAVPQQQNAQPPAREAQRVARPETQRNEEARVRAPESRAHMPRNQSQ
jgi:hypothetical protein